MTIRADLQTAFKLNQQEEKEGKEHKRNLSVYLTYPLLPDGFWKFLFTEDGFWVPGEGLRHLKEYCDKRGVISVKTRKFKDVPLKFSFKLEREGVGRKGLKTVYVSVSIYSKNVMYPKSAFIYPWRTPRENYQEVLRVVAKTLTVVGQKENR